MDFPTAVCTFPAVEYIPLYPEVLAERPTAADSPAIYVVESPQKAGSLAAGVPEALFTAWPRNRVILICRCFRPDRIYYRGNTVKIIAENAPGRVFVAAIESGFFYKDWLSFEAHLVSGNRLASVQWDVPGHVEIRRPGSRREARTLNEP